MPDSQRYGPRQDDESVKIILCGDVMTGRGIDQVLPHPSGPRLCERYVASALEYVEIAEAANGPIPRPADFSYIWGDALDVLAKLRSDVRIINLETSVTKSDDCLPKGINYRMNPENIPCITAAGIDCCVLANNHVLDWRYAGLEETLRTLEGANLKSAGAGRDLAHAQSPATMDVPNKGRVLVYAFGSTTSGIPRGWAATKDTAGVNLLPDLSDSTVAGIAGRIGRAKRPHDVVVASIHWGGNWGYKVPRRQTEFAHALIDTAGVDVVYCHSSHHAKAIEIYKCRPILYGCGDFLNDYEGIKGYEEFRDDLGVMYVVAVTPRTGLLVDLHMVPFQIRNFRLCHASSNDAKWLQRTLDRKSRRFGTRVEMNDDGKLGVASA